MIRIAIPVRGNEGLSSQIFEHFGKSDDFFIIDADSDNIVDTGSVHCELSREEQMKVVDILSEKGVNFIIAGSIGPCMIRRLLDKNIRIFMGAEGTVQDAFKSYICGKLGEVDRSK